MFFVSDHYTQILKKQKSPVCNYCDNLHFWFHVMALLWSKVGKCNFIANICCAVFVYLPLLPLMWVSCSSGPVLLVGRADNKVSWTTKPSPISKACFHPLLKAATYWAFIWDRNTRDVMCINKWYFLSLPLCRGERGDRNEIWLIPLVELTPPASLTHHFQITVVTCLLRQQQTCNCPVFLSLYFFPIGNGITILSSSHIEIGEKKQPFLRLCLN